MNELTKMNTTDVMRPLTTQDLDVLTPEAYLNSLTPEQIGLVFSQLDKIDKFFAGVRKVIEKEVKAGAQVPGLHVVLQEAKPTEGFVGSDEAVAAKLHEMGYSDDAIWKAPSLVSWTNIKTMVKAAGVKELREAGLVGYVKKDPVEKVVYIDPTLETTKIKTTDTE